ncbi:MAG: type II toxin-antitoxin system HicB family antitoxin [Lamprobacter sp.]|uniref:type II toxin-antitoxin system HicB family antitoxin n=1 Tax=Lamprobacter sp. TaxID=3100796 RepID=UPI002B263ED9|nr:type II toxin-antitoxin system HicB family antitoxin [Lamprobacter sp.]MEA3641704.1 type II toxin-antitoxin system HicB family antitoxin [Lamprobacter sp.]
MKGEVTAIIESAPEGGYWAVCPEFPGANGQGETIDEARESLRAAVKLLVEDRLEDCLRGLPAEALRQPLTIA